MLQVNNQSKSIPSSQYYYDMKYSQDYSTFSTLEMGLFSQTTVIHMWLCMNLRDRKYFIAPINYDLDLRAALQNFAFVSSSFQILFYYCQAGHSF